MCCAAVDMAGFPDHHMYIVRGDFTFGFPNIVPNVQLTLDYEVSWTLCALPADGFDLMGNPCKWYSRSMKFAWWVHPILLFSRGRGSERKSLQGPCFRAFRKTTARFRASEQCHWQNIGQLIFATAGDFFCTHMTLTLSLALERFSNYSNKTTTHHLCMIS